MAPALVKERKKVVVSTAYGFDLNYYFANQSRIETNQFLSDILLKYGVSYSDIDAIVNKSKDIFDVRQMRAGKPFAILRRDTTCQADYFIYEPNAYEYLVMQFEDSLSVRLKKRAVELCVEAASGRIESSLWNAMVDMGASFALTSKLEDAFAWSIDFHHIQKGDKFKLIYERKYIEGAPVGIGEIKAAYFENMGRGYYAYFYENEKYAGFYDEEGRPVKGTFLKAPVKYSKITSKYSKNRFHPVLKRRRAHLGTDYAAPYGTPILAVAHGAINRMGYTKGNGKFVKIKHDDTYQTQYLHMQGFAKGMQKGVHVKQGEVIGYVGSTGLASGPHVCFRFWKNGRQINHLRLNFPPAEPMPKEQLDDYIKVKDEFQLALDNLIFDQITENNGPPFDALPIIPN